MSVQGVHEDDLSELADRDNRWGWLDPFAEEAAVEGMEVVAIFVS